MLRKKLKSNHGASLSMALLLFLVCCVIGSVVLAAGTASAGRVSQMTEMDRRYYSVTSAAGLFRDLLNGQSYSVIRTETKTLTETETVTLNNEGTVTAGPTKHSEEETAYTYAFTYKNSTGTETSFTPGSSFLADVILRYVYGEPMDDYGTEDAWGAAPGGAGGAWNFTTEVSNSADALDVTVRAQLRPDGSLLLTFSNTEEGGDPYTITLTMNAAVNDNSAAPESAQTYTRDTTSTEIRDGSNQVTGNRVTTTTVTTTTRTKTTTLVWTSGALGKVVSAP